MDPSGVSMKALERAVAVINRIITNSNVQKGNGAAIDGKTKVCHQSVLDDGARSMERRLSFYS